MIFNNLCAKYIKNKWKNEGIIHDNIYDKYVLLFNKYKIYNHDVLNNLQHVSLNNKSTIIEKILIKILNILDHTQIDIQNIYDSLGNLSKLFYNIQNSNKKLFWYMFIYKIYKQISRDNILYIFKIQKLILNNWHNEVIFTYCEFIYDYIKFNKQKITILQIYTNLINIINDVDSYYLIRSGEQEKLTSQISYEDFIQKYQNNTQAINTNQPLYISEIFNTDQELLYKNDTPISKTQQEIIINNDDLQDMLYDSFIGNIV